MFIIEIEFTDVPNQELIDAIIAEGEKKGGKVRTQAISNNCLLKKRFIECAWTEKVSVIRDYIEKNPKIDIVFAKPGLQRFVFIVRHKEEIALASQQNEYGDFLVACRMNLGDFMSEFKSGRGTRCAATVAHEILLIHEHETIRGLRNVCDILMVSLFGIVYPPRPE